jgi:hypothetical protein
VIIGIILGVILGVLYSFGFVATGIIFWVYLAIGVAGVFLSPIYAANNSCRGNERCFCNFRRLILVASVGTIITAAAGLIVAAIAPMIVTAIVLGLTTFFAVMLLVLIICLARCLCIG